MKTTVIGASAGVGLELVVQLLERGHSVTTLSRRVDTLPDGPAIRKVQGSSLDSGDVSTAIDGSDVVLVTLGTGMSTKANGLYPQSAATILDALATAPNRPPLIVLTGFGAGDSWNDNSPLMKLMFTLFLKDVYAEKTTMEQLISQGYANSMFVRPGRLTNGPLTGRYRVFADLEKGMRVKAISRKDVGHFMAEQAEHPDFLGRYPAIGG